MQELTAPLGGQRAEKSDDDKTAKEKPAEKGDKAGSSTDETKPSEKDDKSKKPAKADPLKDLAKEAGLDQLFSKNTQHGVGLFPVCTSQANPGYATTNKSDEWTS
jgi:hypothetical protein